MSSTQKLNLYRVLSESNQIINANSRHFLALSILFILPVAFSGNLYPTLQRHLLAESKTLTATYVTFVLILSLCAVGTISHSALHVFYGRPVKLSCTLSSLSNSFLPLLVTHTISQVVPLLVCSIIWVLLSLVMVGIILSGGEFSYNSLWLNGLGMIGMVFSAVGLVYLQVNWALASVVVVVESSWGLKPLRRSANLVRGNRRVALSLLMFFGVPAILLWSGHALTAWFGGGGGGDWWSLLISIVHAVVISAFATRLSLHSITASIVLYVHCKAMHGELASEIADQKYISLPFDDEKALHLLSVVQT